MPSVQQLVIDESIDAWNQGQPPPWRSAWRELSRLRDAKLEGGFSPWPVCLSLFATWVTVCWSWWDKRDLFLKGLFAKSYNISQVLNPRVTTSKTAHFSERVCDVPVTAWPLWALLYACCGAQSVPYWKLKWQTGWGKRVFSFSYLVRSVHPTKRMCQQCCHLDLNQLPQVCSAGSKELIT